MNERRENKFNGFLSNAGTHITHQATKGHIPQHKNLETVKQLHNTNCTPSDRQVMRLNQMTRLLL